MKTELFAQNLKKEIKKQGYKLTAFAPDYLDMTIATFTNKCHKGTFTVNDILIVEGVLGIKFADLIAGGEIIAKPIKKVKKQTRSTPVIIKPIQIDKEDIREVKIAKQDPKGTKVKSKLDILRGI